MGQRQFMLFSTFKIYKCTHCLNRNSSCINNKNTNTEKKCVVRIWFLYPYNRTYNTYSTSIKQINPVLKILIFHGETKLPSLIPAWRHWKTSKKSFNSKYSPLHYCHLKNSYRSCHFTFLHTTIQCLSKKQFNVFKTKHKSEQFKITHIWISNSRTTV